MAEWVILTSLKEQVKAVVLNSALHNAGIDSRVSDHRDSAYVFLGSIDVLVPKADLEKAEAILADIDDRDEAAEDSEV